MCHIRTYVKPIKRADRRFPEKCRTCAAAATASGGLRRLHRPHNAKINKSLAHTHDRRELTEFRRRCTTAQRSTEALRVVSALCACRGVCPPAQLCAHPPPLCDTGGHRTTTTHRPLWLHCYRALRLPPDVSMSAAGLQRWRCVRVSRANAENRYTPHTVSSKQSECRCRYRRRISAPAAAESH